MRKGDKMETLWIIAATMVILWTLRNHPNRKDKATQ